MLREAVCASITLFLVALVGLARLLPSGRDETRATGVALAALARQQKLGVLPSPRKATLSQCPEEGAFEPPPAVARENCHLEVHNHQLDNIEIIYVIPSPTGGEKRYWIIDYNSSFDIGSFSGDRWRLRSRRGQLLKEFTVPACHTLPARRYVVHLDACMPRSHEQRPLAPALPNDVALDAAQSASCGTHDILASQPQPGMHLLCLSPAPALAQAAFAVAAFAHSESPLPGAALRPTHRFVVPRAPSKAERLAAARDVAEGEPGDDVPDEAADGAAGEDGAVTPATLIALTLSEMERPVHPKPQQPAALFDGRGQRLRSAAALRAAVHAQQGVLLMEGGQWMWPAPRLGHTWEVEVG